MDNKLELFSKEQPSISQIVVTVLIALILFAGIVSLQIYTEVTSRICIESKEQKDPPSIGKSEKVVRFDYHELQARSWLSLKITYFSVLLVLIVFALAYHVFPTTGRRLLSWHKPNRKNIAVGILQVTTLVVSTYFAVFIASNISEKEMWQFLRLVTLDKTLSDLILKDLPYHCQRLLLTGPWYLFAFIFSTMALLPALLISLVTAGSSAKYHVLQKEISASPVESGDIDLDSVDPYHYIGTVQSSLQRISLITTEVLGRIGYAIGYLLVLALYIEWFKRDTEFASAVGIINFFPVLVIVPFCYAFAAISSYERFLSRSMYSLLHTGASIEKIEDDYGLLSLGKRLLKRFLFFTLMASALVFAPTLLEDLLKPKQNAITVSPVATDTNAPNPNGHSQDEGSSKQDTPSNDLTSTSPPPS